jgi:RHS repeat-associated protein
MGTASVGLDYFGARYFSGAQGRFTSPDKPFADQHPVDPQSWNLYSYTRNNPLKFVDIAGRYIVVAAGYEAARQYISTAVRSPSGRALIERIAADPRPTFVSAGRLPVGVSPSGGHTFVNGTTTVIPGETGKAGGTQVLLDPVNAIVVGALTGQSIFKTGLTALTHELNHVDDANRAGSLQGAAAAGAAGDAPSRPGANDTVGGTAEARAQAINGELGNTSTAYTPDQDADGQANKIIQDGQRSFWNAVVGLPNLPPPEKHQ